VFVKQRKDDLKKMGEEAPKPSSPISIAPEAWTRDHAMNDTKTLYIFNDNGDRNSG